MAKTLTLTPATPFSVAKKKKHYIALDQVPLLYLCENESWTNDKRFALAINKKEVADLACYKLNETINDPPFCIVVSD